MSSPQYCIFVCTKQRHPNAQEGCCCNVGALEIYQAFQDEIQKRELGENVEVRPSGCLDHCEAGVVALVYQPKQNEFSWLPTKLRLKLRRLLFPNRHLYGHLTCTDVPVIVDSHIVNGQPLKRYQISQQ